MGEDPAVPRYQSVDNIRHSITSARYTLTATKRDTSLGKQRPVVSPNGVLVAIQPNSSRISAPIRVEEMRPMTKKQVLQIR